MKVKSCHVVCNVIRCSGSKNSNRRTRVWARRAALTKRLQPASSLRGPLFQPLQRFVASGSKGCSQGSRRPLSAVAAVAEESVCTNEEVLQYYRTPGFSSSYEDTLLEKVKAKVSPNVECISSEQCYNVQLTGSLASEEQDTLSWLLRETFEPEKLKERSSLKTTASSVVVEVGPRMNFSTAWSTNAVSICQACGLSQVKRMERSNRFLLTCKDGTCLSETEIATFAAMVHDRMTECVYVAALTSFKSDVVPEEVRSVPVMEHGRAALEEVNQSMGLCFDDWGLVGGGAAEHGPVLDDWDLDYYTKLFRENMKRDPTTVELFDIAQSNSEHSRHWFFKATLVFDGEAMPKTLFEIVMDTWAANPDNSVIAFKDNSSALRGFKAPVLWPEQPGKPSKMTMQEKDLDLLLTAETHNFPCSIAPYPGAETGAGGRIRDTHATGRGSIMTAGTAGYCVGNLCHDDAQVPGEPEGEVYPPNLAPPLQILMDASNGASDYGNKFGEPLVQGYTRTFGQRLPNGERREWLKPIMFSGGVGAIDHTQLEKYPGEVGMLVVKIGGPAYRIGMGGGAASSITAGTRDAELDFDAVQRGDGEMSQKLYRVVRTCVEMGDASPIISIHDQGAGGNCNVVKELIEPLGGKIDIRAVNVADETMSVLEIWGAEYQENDAMLIRPESEGLLRSICARERCPMAVLGSIDGSGRVTIFDSQAPPDTPPAEDLELEKVLGDLPNKTYTFARTESPNVPLELPEDATVETAADKVLRLPAVGSKRFLTTKVDRSVTGLIAQQQCCGPLQLPVSDVAVIAQSTMALTGTAFSIGEQPLKGLVDPEAMGRMSTAEALTNLVFAKITKLQDVKASGNWMWAAKMEGEGPGIYACAEAMRDTMIAVGMAIDGGKDSVSMAANAGGESVKAPSNLVISAYAPCPDITLTVTPDLKLPGGGRLIHVDIAAGERRMGGSALAQAYGQLGDSVPDLDDVEVLTSAFCVTQELMMQRKVSAGHDISDGGILTAMLEMAFAGNCGIAVDLPMGKGGALAEAFAEELGLVLEVAAEDEEAVLAAFQDAEVPARSIGTVLSEPTLNISIGGESVLEGSMTAWRDTWEATSFSLERLQASADTVAQEEAGLKERTAPTWDLTFAATATPEALLQAADKPRVAVVREEGSNGDREMCAALYAGGLEPWDVNMMDLANGRISLADFRGVVFVGGFSYADVLDSAKGWAAGIRFNPELQAEFQAFYERPDTFSLGVCNGCQLMALLGWVPGSGSTEERLPDTEQPRLVHNASGRFESRWSTLRVQEDCNSVLLKGMAGSTLGVWVAHGEGQVKFPDADVMSVVNAQGQAPLRYVDDQGKVTEAYPANPNGSPEGIAALCSADGRHLAMMPHPERCFLTWQMPWVPTSAKLDPRGPSPWLKLFQNAREWCDQAAQ
ncbi:hypothetical protein CYMTET_11738 [Cymbomonas tetramitiformis]|uniref:phosphoribosylformylglycinamidine synthase n=1 Tax=Cymbomonas tetramitiformis TaxID=36881 RepID=A0AAE0GM37_9CHLO|nr:hypothetical protein CYMTET_11738 [Cymbomonas tetramitiformis]